MPTHHRLPTHRSPNSSLRQKLLLTLWQPELSQEFGAALLPLCPDGLVPRTPNHAMPRSWQVLHCPGVAVTEVWYLDPENVVVDLWQTSHDCEPGM